MADKKRTHITDHALVQYMRRAMGMDVDALKQQIFDRNPGLWEATQTDASSFYTQGFTFAIAGNSVTTVIEGRPNSRESSRRPSSNKPATLRIEARSR